MPRRPTLLIALLTCLAWGATPFAQTLSDQVLRLLTRTNTWSGVNTYANTVGLKLESGGGLSSPTCTDRLENRGGNLYFNCVLVTASAGVGTVTSVALTAPSILSVSGSPVTSSGTLALSLATQTANTVFAGPTTGSAATPTFRALVTADLPLVNASSGLTGQVPVANGGTGLSSGTSGGIPYFSGTTTMASSGALTANRLVLGGGAGAAPTVVGSLGSATTVLHGNAAGAPTFGAVVLTSDVSGTLPVANGGTGLTSGTSGGVPYFSGSTTIASSSALTANRIVLGGGAGAAPTVLGSLGTTTTVLHGNAAGAPTFGAVSLTADVSGTLPVTNGGTGLSTATQGDLLYASGANTWAKLAKSTSATRYLANTGSSNNPAWAQVDLSNGVTGALTYANGGTGLTAAPTNGQLAIGNGTGYSLAALTGTANQITVTNGAGTITLSTPQAIAPASTPEFARIGLGTGAGASAVLTTSGQFDLGFVNNGNCGAADTIDWDAGQVQYSTLSAATCTYTFANPVSGATYTLIIWQDATGGRLVSWPGTVAWAGATTPTILATPSLATVCRFTWSGAAYQGFCQGATDGAVFAASTTVTNAQMLTLVTTPVPIIASPGSGARIVFLSADLRTNLTAGYTNVNTDGDLYLAWGTTRASTLITNNGALTDLDDFLTTNAVSTATLTPRAQNDSVTSEPVAEVYNSAFTNTALNLVAVNSAGDYTGGNSANTITVTVYYQVR